ncbi:MAG: helix-hairpin-helix domain-containing protein [Pseudomonadota bacterium]
MSRHAGNVAIAAKLREMADVLEQQQADGFRVAAYRRAAGTIEDLATPVESLLNDKDPTALIELPGIGRGIAAAIAEMVGTGRWTQLERLRGALAPEQLFRTVPGIGPKLAERIHDELHIDTLEALELASHDGRLDHVPGIGARRAAAIRASLGERLGRRRIKLGKPAQMPAVADLLDVDREYRARAERGELRTIAPKRFNPSGEAWLPVLHTRRGDWAFTVLYSNTRKAHELGKTRDWVVVYFHHGTEPEAQCTIVTEPRGALAGRRVVRGREGETASHYAEAISL